MAEGETEDFVKEEVIFGCFAFFCMSLYILVRCHDSLHLAFKFQAPLHQPQTNDDKVIRHLEAFLQSTGSQLRPDPCACARVTAKERGTHTAMHKYYQNSFSANKQERDAQTRERGGSAVFNEFK
jgi:hypothetical protein